MCGLEEIATKTGRESTLAHDIAHPVRNNCRDASALCQRDKIAQIIGVFSSARKRSVLTADEVVIFLAIGHLSVSVINDVIVTRPVGLAEVALLLGIPKETVRRKMLRLAVVEYVGCSPKGIAITKLDTWCRMFERIAG